MLNLFRLGRPRRNAGGWHAAGWLLVAGWLLADGTCTPAGARPAPHPRHRPYIVALDPGHGGRDPGAVRRRPGLVEKRITLDVARRVARNLRRRGIRVRLSRRGDRTLPPRVRARWLDQTRSDVLVSLHCDAARTHRHTESGATTYYHAGGRAGARGSRPLARSIQRRLVRAAATRDRGVRPDRTRFRRGFYMLRRAHRPAALVELGYLSNPATARSLRQARYRERLARGVSSGVLAYLR